MGKLYADRQQFYVGPDHFVVCDVFLSVFLVDLLRQLRWARTHVLAHLKAYMPILRPTFSNGATQARETLSKNALEPKQESNTETVY